MRSGAHTQSMIISMYHDETSDLREYLTNKRSVAQPHHSYCCHQLITAMLIYYHYKPQKSFVFSRLSALELNVPKRRHMQTQNLDSDKDLPVVTSNMVNKGRRPTIKEHSSETEMEEAHHYTHLKTGTMAPRDYKKLVGNSD